MKECYRNVGNNVCEMGKQSENSEIVFFIAIFKDNEIISESEEFRK